MLFSSLCIFWKKLSLILCLNEVTLFVDFKSDDRLFHIFAPSRSDTFGKCYFCKTVGLI